MLILDEATQRLHDAAKGVERTREVTISGSQNESRDAKWVADQKRSVANLDRQMGKRLSPEQFITKLQTINPNIILEPHPGKLAPQDSAFYRVNKDKACLHLNTGGQKIFLLVCEGDFMPEWTLFSVKEIKVPDSNKPDSIWTPQLVPHRKVKRGWREVLIMLIWRKVVALEAVERVFGVGDRPSWKTLTGKGTGDIFS